MYGKSDTELAKNTLAGPCLYAARVTRLESAGSARRGRFRDSWPFRPVSFRQRRLTDALTARVSQPRDRSLLAEPGRLYEERSCPPATGLFTSGGKRRICSAVLQTTLDINFHGTSANIVSVFPADGFLTSVSPAGHASPALGLKLCGRGDCGRKLVL